MAIILSPKQRKAKKVHDLYQNVCRDHDAMKDISSFGLVRVWRKNVEQEISANRFGHILDVCCGTGAMTLALATNNPAAEVVGVDFSHNMITIANHHAAEKALGNVEFFCEDANELHFSDGYFDCVVVSFGLSGIPDYDKFLREMNRVLIPGGSIFILDYANPEDDRLKVLLSAGRSVMMPAAGLLLAGKGKDFLKVSLMEGDVPSSKKVCTMLQKNGFEHIGARPITGGMAACYRAQKIYG
jgi:demethylmenaquinone methyltransferase/2-methoxy-6-polyprenyl-1,4-benzoquinol methylase